MVERHPRGFHVSRDFGCTCRTLAIAFDLDGILDVILTQSEGA
jgi:hypothetical protein